MQWLIRWQMQSLQMMHKDYAKAAKLYRPLAEQGDAIAQTRLAEMYERGQGVLQDYKEVAKWTRLAAEQGNAVGQSLLGALYKDGVGVPQDYVLAHMWTNIASVNEISKSGHSLTLNSVMALQHI
jgi:TPR repeat protein